MSSPTSARSPAGSRRAAGPKRRRERLGKSQCGAGGPWRSSGARLPRPSPPTSWIATCPSLGSSGKGRAASNAYPARHVAAEVSRPGSAQHHAGPRRSQARVPTGGSSREDLSGPPRSRQATPRGWRAPAPHGPRPRGGAGSPPGAHGFLYQPYGPELGLAVAIQE